MSQGALTAAAAGEEVVPASEYRALQAQVRDLHRLLGKKAMENELLREAVSRAAGLKKLMLRSPASVRDAQPTTATTARPTAIARCRAGRRDPPARGWLTDPGLRRGRLYGYLRVHAGLRRQAEKARRAAPNPKRGYRVMKVHGLLLQRDGERREERRHDGWVAVDQRNTRSCTDGFEIACYNSEKVRVRA